ncbi:hypothetical protein DW047_19835 [Phocaeicola vulgatus]|nr:hypothetical protein DW047_19835 [Phocaeicola vulgatus]
MHNKTQIAGWTFKNLVVDIIFPIKKGFFPFINKNKAMHNKTQIAGWTFKNLVVDIISDLYPKATSTFVPANNNPAKQKYTIFSNEYCESIFS